MTLIHPWAVGLGAGAIALPILVHWLTRPRPVRLPLSTIRFVQEVVRQRRALHRLRDAIVLGLRSLAVVLLAWAFARPILGQWSQLSSAGAKAVRVVILDASQSMAAQSQGIQAFERGRSIAAGYLTSQYGVQADVILAGASPRPIFDRLSGNLNAQKELLGKAGVRPERLNVRAALAKAADLFATGPAEPGLRRELIVVSDFQQSSWLGADFSVLPKDVAMQLESVAPARTPANLGLLRCGVRGRAEPGRPVRLEAEVGNYSPASRTVQVEVTVGSAVYRLDGLCPPLNTATLATDVQFAEPGWLTGQARLVNVEDALPADDVRPVVVQVRPAPMYVLISRQPAERTNTSSYFLAKALAPISAGAQAVATQPATERVLRIQPSRVDRQTLGAADLIVLDHPGKLSSECTTMLAGLLRYGRPVLYVTAEEADATNLKMLTDAAELQLPVDFLPPAKDRRRRDLLLADIRRDQSPFSIFGDGVLAAIEPLRFSGGLPTWRPKTGLTDDILASFNDKSACLVATTCGQGCLAVLNVDLEASNLVRSPAFVPLLAELAGRMYGQQAVGRPVPCGEPMSVYLPVEAGLPAGLQMVGPEGASEMGGLTEDGMGVLWRWQEPGQPGTYEIRRGAAAVYAVAAAIPAEESDLRPVPADVLTQRLVGGREVHYHGVTGQQQDHKEAWPWLMVACAACLLAEMLALRAFRT